MKKLTLIFSQWLLTIFLLTGVQFTAASQAATHLHFDGVNDYAVAPSIIFANQSFTIEFWAKRTSFGTYQHIASEGNFAPNQFLGILFRLNNTISISFYNNDLNSSTAIVDANWHHYAFTFNSTTKLQAIYIDGVLNASRTATANTTATGPFYIGQAAFGGQTFSGNLEELRIWNIERTGAAINATKNNVLLGNESGLVAYYNFNQGIAGGNNTAITTLTNTTANPLNGTITNFTLTGTTSNFLAGSPVDPMSGTHLNFDGLNDFVNVPSTSISATLSGTAALTVEAWVKSTIADYTPVNIYHTGSIVTNHRPSGATQFSLRPNGTKYEFFLGFGTYSVQSPANAITPGVWQHIAGVFNGSNIKLYINGILVGTTNTPGYTLPVSSEAVLIGNSGYGEPFNGSIDEVRIWNSILSTDDIVRRKNCELLGNEPGLYTYYKFNQGFAGGTNTTVTSLTNSTATVGLNGTLTNMALTGNTSNWLAGSAVTTGSIIPAAPPANAQSLCTGTSVANLIPSPSPTINWYIAATGGTPLAGTTVLASGTYYAAEINANGCESTRTPVSVSITNMPPAPPIVTTPVTYCPNEIAAPLSATGTDLRWYTTATGGIGSIIAPIPNTATLGTSSYWVASSLAGTCESNRTKIDVVIDGNLPAIADNNAIFLQLLDVTGVTSFSNGCIELISKVTPNGTSPISGATYAWVWIEGIQDPQFVNRHYQITPDNNASAATGRITLYFTQQEFSDFNAVNTIKLPTNPSDASGKANLVIEKYSGESNDGSGLPYSYTEGMIVINPADADIVWNSIQNRWEVSFDVTGFSGFFVKTQLGTLPLRLISFTASKLSNTNVQLQWQANNEVNVNRYEVESSSTSSNFIKIGTVSATNLTNYQLIDNRDWNSEVRYYRLKMIDNDGSFKYSTVVRVSNNQVNSGINIYPNPVTDVFTIQITDKNLLHTAAQLTDVSGKLIRLIQINNSYQNESIVGLPKGLYILKFADGSIKKIVKE